MALVGPVKPFRGGIAQYTTELHRALSTRCDLQTLSFRRQYPAWLYPGKSDREPGMEGHVEHGVDYILDALNPSTWAATARSIAARGCDLAVIDWWTLFWAPGFALIAQMLRRRGVPVVFICHNLFDHDSGAIKRALSTKLLSQANAYLVHSQDQAIQLRNLFPDKPVLTHPHPTHDRFPDASKLLPKRGRLELLFFGFIRPYKGLDVLADALARLNDREVYLTVVGEPWCAPKELRNRIRATGAPNVELHLDYVEATDAANFFARADLVVLPYRSATGSAVAAVAYHYDRPLLATRVGGLPDVIEDGRTGFLIDPDSAGQLAARLRSTSREELGQMHVYIRAYKTRFTWSSLADSLVDMAHDMRQIALHRGAPGSSN
ncbi:MAG: glycosyltransferase [Rhodanobacteraceae bacterium]